MSTLRAHSIRLATILLAMVLSGVACTGGSSPGSEPLRDQTEATPGWLEEDVNYANGPITLPQTIVSPSDLFTGQSVIVAPAGTIPLERLAFDGPYELVFDTPYETVRVPIAEDGSFSAVLKTGDPLDWDLLWELGLGGHGDSVQFKNSVSSAVVTSNTTAVMVHVTQGTLTRVLLPELEIPTRTARTPSEVLISPVSGSAGVNVAQDAQHPTRLNLLGRQAVVPGAQVLLANHDRQTVYSFVADGTGSFDLEIEGEVNDLLLFLQIVDLDGVPTTSMPVKALVDENCVHGLCLPDNICIQPPRYEWIADCIPIQTESCDTDLFEHCPREVCKFDLLCGPEAYLDATP